MNWKKIAALSLVSAMAVSSLAGCSTNQASKEITGQTAAPEAGENSTVPFNAGVRDFSTDQGDGLKQVQGSGSFSVADGTLDVTSTEGDDLILIDEKAQDLHNVEVAFSFDPKNDNQNALYGVILRYAEDGSWTFVGQDGHSAKDPFLTSWVMCTSDGKKEKLLTDGQRVYARREKPYTIKVRLVENALTLYLDNHMIYSGEVNGVTQGSGKAGLRYVNGSGAHVQYLSINEAPVLNAAETVGAAKSIASKALTVSMDEAFPRVIDYTLASTGNSLPGQVTPFYAVEINNTQYTPTVTSEFSADQAIYHVSVDPIKVSFDVSYKVTDNVLRMELSNVKEDAIAVKTINFPGQSLVSMKTDSPGAALRVNNYRTEQIYQLKDVSTDRTFSTTSLAVLSNDEIAATINNGNLNNRQEIAYQTTKAEDSYFTGLWTNEYQYKGLDQKELDALWTEVAITGDRNGDEKVNYEDGAIARRDDIGTLRLGSDDYRNSMSMIAMDVGSIAQFPFLRILDNIKKFHAGTDGFGQMILIKGYQSEGHDASHPDFANISQRAGGIEDFKLLLNEAEKYGAKIGVHINHTEAYPEAKQYSEQLVADTEGWTWYDDSYHLIRENDILNEEEGTDKRLDDLNTITDGKLSMIYVDTYQDSRWQMDRIAQKINDLGWSLGTEYSEEMIKLSTWSHTLNATNFDYTTQGNLVRFIDNESKDIFGNTDLFRGLVNRNTNAGFNGWQNCFSYDETMNNFYSKLLPQRYLANFPVNTWPSVTKVMLGAENQVVTEMVDGVNQISKDGHLIADGDKIFIPWDPQNETKIYHWNPEGGESTWTLPSSWDSETSVRIFTLTDAGRSNEIAASIKEDRTLTIKADPKTAYVIYKGSQEAGVTDMTSYDWGQGSPVTDMGFDSHTFGYGWEKSSSSGKTNHITFESNAAEGAHEVDARDNKNGNTHLHIKGGHDAVVTQTMEGLKPGQSYSASVFVQANQGRKTTLSVTLPDGIVVENHTDDYSVLYGNPHNDRFASAYQRVKLNFTMPEGAETAEIKLTAAKDGTADSFANFDNVRVTPVEISDAKGHYFFEDFEHVDQEFGPFLCPTKSTQSHLSQENGEWTKDVIDGTYSFKVRGNGNKDTKFNYFRTASHRLRLEPDTTYTMGMDYMITDVKANQDLNGAPAFIIGVKSQKAADAGDQAAAVVTQFECKADDYAAHATGDITFTTGNYDDYYIELLDETYSREFVIDNLYVDQK